MNVIWIVADTFRRDHIGAYGNEAIHTPSLDQFAARSVRFDNNYAASFPTMPNRADYCTGCFTASFMSWEPLPVGQVTLAQILLERGCRTTGIADTPFYIRSAMNYDRGFETFYQIGAQARFFREEGYEDRLSWRFETDHDAPRTFAKAMQWLEHHYKEDFFLYIDTWDPHEPWDAPSYYTELYWPDHDGEVIDPFYNYWQKIPGFTEEKLKKAHATYCGEVTMVDTWFGYFLRQLENMDLTEKTAIIFSTDHGFSFGEHGGMFGKTLVPSRPDGSPYVNLRDWQLTRTGWQHSYLGEEIVATPLIIYVPGVTPGVYKGLTSAVDLMPTVLDILRQEIPANIDGHSLLPVLEDHSLKGREFVISTSPFWNPGDTRPYTLWYEGAIRNMVTYSNCKVTTSEWTLLYDVEPGESCLYHLASDPKELKNVIGEHPEIARELHQLLVGFMRASKVPPQFLEPRLELKF